MDPDTASRPSISVVHAAPPEDAAVADRWRLWQQRNAVTSRKEAGHARIAFAVLFTVLAVWLGRVLLSPTL